MSHQGQGDGPGHEAIELVIVDLGLPGEAVEDDFAADEERGDGDEHHGVEERHCYGKYQPEEDCVELNCVVKLPVELVVKEALFGLAVALGH